jgi:hypothetical protein
MKIILTLLPKKMSSTLFPGFGRWRKWGQFCELNYNEIHTIYHFTWKIWDRNSGGRLRWMFSNVIMKLLCDRHDKYSAIWFLNCLLRFILSYHLMWFLFCRLGDMD